MTKVTFTPMVDPRLTLDSVWYFEMRAAGHSHAECAADIAECDALDADENFDAAGIAYASYALDADDIPYTYASRRG